MKIYVLLKQDFEERNQTVCVSEDIDKIKTSICEDIDVEKDYPKFEIWKDGEQIYHTYGDDVSKKVEEEINNTCF